MRKGVSYNVTSGVASVKAMTVKSACSDLTRHTRVAVLGIVMAGALIMEGGCATHHVPPAETAPEIGRLSVRPKTMASGTQTVRAGVQWLDSLYMGDSLIREAVLYVPQRAVGTRRVPLFVFLHGSAMDGSSMIMWDHQIFQQFADSNNVIVLAPTSQSIPAKDWGSKYLRDNPNVDVPRIDAAIRLVIQHYAIDPSRIALVGFSSGSGLTVDLGYVNGDVFSRVVAFSGFEPFLVEHEFDILRPHGPRRPFFIGLNTKEAQALRMPAFVAWLRNAGYAVTYTEDSRGHYSRGRALEGLNWIMKSWQ